MVGLVAGRWCRGGRVRRGGGKELSGVLADAAAPGAVRAFGFAGFDDVDGLVAEPVADGFGGGGFVTAEEEPAVAVAGDGFQSSLYRLLPWETVCRMIEQLMPRERMVATSLTKFGILPMLANSSSRQCASRPSRPPSVWLAFLTRVSKRHW